MTLHDAIIKVLKDSRRPLTTKEISEMVNKSGLYKREDGKPVQASQIFARINSYSEYFDNVNGEIFLAEDETWKGFIKAYSYFQNLLKRYGQRVEFLVIFFFFLKRIDDVNSLNQKGERFSLREIRNQLVHGYEAGSIMSYFSAFIQNLSLFYPELSNSFQRSLQELKFILQERNGERVLSEIVIFLNTIDTKHLSGKDFGVIFEYFINKSIYNTTNGRYYTPKTLKEIMVQLIDEPSKLFPIKVYDPFSGTCGVFTELDKNTNFDLRYYGNEINRDIYELGLMNLIMHEIDHVTLEQRSALSTNYSNNFDIVISDLPLGVQVHYKDYLFHNDLANSFPIRLPNKGDALPLYIYQILTSLRPGGKAVITVPDGFLFNGGVTKRFREFLVKSGFIDFVVSVPHGILQPYSGVKISILVLTKKQGSSGIIKFVDLNSDYKEENLHQILSSAKLNQSSKYVTIAENEEILENDATLVASAYGVVYKESRRLLKDGRGRYLGEMVEISGGTRGFQYDQYGVPFIRAQNLSEEILDTTLSKENLRDIELSKVTSQRSIINSEVLLFNRLGSTVKPTIYKPSSDTPSIQIHSDVYALKVKPGEEVSLEYLYYQFYSPFVQLQIKVLQKGVTFSHITIHDLSKVIIPIVNYQAQKDFVETQRASLIQLEKEKMEERLRIIGYKEEVAGKESNIVQTLVHQLRPSLSSLFAQGEKIQRIAETHKIGELKEVLKDDVLEEDPELMVYGYEAPKNHSLSEVCQKLLDDAQQLNDKLSYVEKIMKFKLSPKDFLETKLVDFLNDYVKLKRIEIQDKYKVLISGENVLVEINQPSFKEMLDQLLLNAEKHAFSSSGNKDQEIKFSVKLNYEKQLCILEYSNNGKPFSLSLDDLLKPFVKGQGSSGSGIGGNYIEKIVLSHGGSIELNKKLKTGLGLRFEIPLKQKHNGYDE